jgi:hypothetical protein
MTNNTKLLAMRDVERMLKEGLEGYMRLGGKGSPQRAKEVVLGSMKQHLEASVSIASVDATLSFGDPVNGPVAEKVLRMARYRYMAYYNLFLLKKSLATV